MEEQKEEKGDGNADDDNSKKEDEADDSTTKTDTTEENTDIDDTTKTMTTTTTKTTATNVNTMTNEHVRCCMFAILQSGYKTLTHLRSRLTRFKELIINLIAIENDEDNNKYNLEVVNAIYDFWHLNPVMLMHTLNILVEYRIINGADVMEFFLLNNNNSSDEVTSTSSNNKKALLWYTRYWPWEIMNSVLLRTFNKECIAAPRPYAGLQIELRNKETDEIFEKEIKLRKNNYEKMKSVIVQCREKVCTNEEELVVLNKRYECLLSTFYKVKEEFE